MANKTWNDVSADWDVPGDWGPTPGLPAATDVAIFASNSAYVATIGTAGGATETELVAGVTLADSQAALAIAAGSTLAVTGAIDLAAGTLVLGGLLNGGTLDGAGGSVLVQSGATLNGGAIAGTLAVTENGSTLDVIGGLAFQSGAGPGTLVMGGYDASLTFLDSETLSGGELVLGGIYYPGILLAGTGDTETFGAGFTLDVADNSVLSGSFVNLGTVTVGTSDQLTVGLGSFSNQGIIAVASQGTLTVTGSLGVPVTNAGSIALAAGGEVLVEGTMSTAQLVALAGEVSGAGTIDFIGTLINTGQTLAVTAGSPLADIVLDGDVIGGTIIDGASPGGGDALRIGGGTLDAVTFQGVLNYGTTEYVTIAVRDGLTVLNGQGGPGTIVMGGLSDALDILDGETLGPLVLDMTQTYQSVVASSPTLTLAPGFTLAAAGGQDFVQAATLFNNGSIGVAGSLDSLDLDTATLVNNGIISAGAGAVLSIDTSPLYGGAVGQALSLTGSGAFALANGSTLVMGADQTTAQLIAILGTSTGVTVSVLGTLNNTGTVLAVAAGTPLGRVNLAADVIGGTIINAGSLTVGAGTFQSLTFGGALNFANDVQVNFAGGVAFEPGSTINLAGSSSYDYLNITDNETLDGVVVTMAGSGDRIEGATGTLNFGPALTVDVTGPNAGIQAENGVLNNAGTIAVTGTGSSLTLFAPTLNNSGTIAVGAGRA